MPIVHDPEFINKEDYTDEISTLLRQRGYGPHLNLHHIRMIADLVANQEEWDNDPTAREIIWMYEILGWQAYNDYDTGE